MGRLAKTVPITLDKDRTLKFDLNAFCLAEEKSKTSLQEIVDRDRMSMTELRAYLWAGLVHEDADLTLEQVGALVSLANMGEVGAKILEAISASMPEEEKRPTGEPVEKSA